VNLSHTLRKTSEIKTIIFPNRLDKSYNPIFALQVFKAVNKLYPGLILIMNTTGELKEQCISFIHNNNLTSSVEFLDKIMAWDELPEIYRKADIALFTATDSNGPNTLIECMASGTGVVMSKYIHNTGAYAIDKENCFICDLDIQSYVNAIVQYIEIDGLIAKNGIQSKKLVANRSIQATAKLYFEIIENTLFE
jgi:glycosyltransferase involved in cell wall biosynthesis